MQHPAPPEQPVPQSVIDGLAALGVATVHEAMGCGDGLMDADLRPIQQGRTIAGRALTVSAPEGDNWALHIALARAAPGDVLVVAAEGGRPFGYFGDIMGTAAMARGCAGLVIAGGVRDTAQLRQMGFAVWSRHVAARGTVKARPGTVGDGVDCAGARVRPGDVIVADDDGVVVVPASEAAAILAAGRERLRREDAMRKAVLEGRTTLDLLGLSAATGTANDAFDPSSR